jgi:hypothetical protein
MATRDIPANDTIVVVPNNAILSIFDAYRSATFNQALKDAGLAALPMQPNGFGGRVGSTFLMEHQVILGLYMAHMTLMSRAVAAAATAGAASGNMSQQENWNPGFSPAEPFAPYVDFMPRGEGNFSELTTTLRRLVDHSPAANTILSPLAIAHNVAAPELRDALVWALTMVLSRAVPITHRPTLLRVAEDTPFDALFKGVPPPDAAPITVPLLVPLVDMINHSAAPNAEVVVPEVETLHARCLIARSLRPIAAGEEITMQYTAADDLQVLRTFYGISQPEGKQLN